MRDSVTCLLAAPPTEMFDAVRTCRDARIRVRVATRLPLLAVTVNPFLPRPEGFHYVADSVSAEDLGRTMRASIHTPVVDIIQDGAEALWQEISGWSLDRRKV